MAGLLPGCFNPGGDDGSSTTDAGSTGGTSGPTATSVTATTTAGTTDATTATTQGPGTNTASTTANPTTGEDTTDGGDETTDGGDTSGGSSTGEEAACDTRTHVCAASLGEGWSEPFARTADESEPCAGDYGTELSALQTDLDAEAASCDCGCGTPTVTCSSNMSAIGYSGASCAAGTGQGSHSLSAGACYTQVGSLSHSVSYSAASATCGSGSVTESIPEATWRTSVLACGGAEPAEGVCDGADELCLPQPGEGFDGNLCVMQAGDHECPDLYPDKTLYYDDFADSRACPASCSCSPAGYSCYTSVARYDGASCTGLQFLPNTNVSSASNACVIQGAVTSMRPGVPVVDEVGTCSGSANATGEATPTGETTVCCTAT